MSDEMSHEMSDDRFELIARIRALHNEMREHALRALDNEGQWDAILNFDLPVTIDMLQYVLHALIELKINQYAKIVSCWTQKNATDAQWTNLRLFTGSKSVLPEQKGLRRVQKDFKSTWFVIRKQFAQDLRDAQTKADKQAAETRGEDPSSFNPVS